MTELIRLLYASDTFILRVSINLCLNENIIERFFVAVFKHTLKIFAIVVGAGHGAVDVGADDDKIVALCIIVADVELTFDGLLGLPLGTVPRVDDCHIFLWTLFKIFS